MDYNELTPTEILKKINDINKLYGEYKDKSIYYLKEVEKIDKILNELATPLEELELEYVKLMGILVEKQNNEELGK